MKKLFLITFIAVFASVFFLSSQAQSVFAKAKQGGTLKVIWADTSANFGDPIEMRGPAGYFGQIAIQGLIRGPISLGNYEPLLATSMELSPDKKSYTFKLRKNVEFHDGTDFNAQAVKWNLERTVAAKNPFLKSVTSIEVIDDHTVRVNISKWNTLLADDFARDGCLIISPTAFEKNGAKWVQTNPVGTGPFKLKTYKRNQECSYDKFDDYWRDGYPYLDGISNYAVTDKMTQSAMLQKGGYHAIRETDAVQVLELEKNKDYKPAYFPGGNMILWFNSTDPNSIWSNNKMREAMEYALDKKAIATAVGRGFSDPVYEMLFGVNAIGNPGTTPREFDLNKAKQLMKEAGYASGVKAELIVFEKFYSDAIVAIQHQLEKVGIEITIEKVTGPAWNEIRFANARPNTLYYDRQRGGGPIVNVATKEDFGPNAMGFKGLMRPDGFFDLLDQALHAEDPAKQISFFEGMERVAHKDAMHVPVYNVPGMWLISNNIKSDRDWESTWFVGGRPDVFWEHLYLDE